MTKYRINTTDNSYQKDEGNLGAFFYSSDWREATQAEVDSYELQKAKDSAITNLNRNREDHCLKDITQDNIAYKITAEAKNALTYIIGSLHNDTDSSAYFSAEGQNVTLTKTKFKELASSIQTREVQSRIARASKKQQIEACTTIEQVNQIDITF